MHGWRRAAEVDREWNGRARGDDYGAGGLAGASAAHVAPIAVKMLANGDAVFDMGQNMVGWTKLRVNGAARDYGSSAVCGAAESGWECLYGESA